MRTTHSGSHPKRDLKLYFVSNLYGKERHGTIYHKSFPTSAG